MSLGDMIHRSYHTYRYVIVSIGLWVSNASAGQTDTLEIIEETIAALVNCLKWTIIGLCVWLDCDVTSCRIQLSVLYGNYNPDLVISGYHRVGDNPWQEMAVLYGGLQKQVGQQFAQSMINVDIGEGDRPNDRYYRAHDDLRFKESDAIGHPLDSEALLSAALDLGLVPAGTIVPPTDFSWASLDDSTLLCPSETTPFTPYLLSTLDYIAWRLSIPETIYPEALVPGLREIGHWPTNTWQALYPRSGFVIQSEDPKAGAVVAQRAGDVVTRIGQPHVYLPTSSTRSTPVNVKVWYPGALIETQADTGTFQMHVPLRQQRCEVFGQNDLAASWATGKNDLPPTPETDDGWGDYAWTLWRPYECCVIKGQVLLFTIRWTEFP